MAFKDKFLSLKTKVVSEYCKSTAIKTGVILTLFFFAASIWYVWGTEWSDKIFEFRNLSTFLLLGWNAILLWHSKEDVSIALTEGKFKDNNQTITVTRKQKKNISDLTNIVSAKFYDGGKIDDSVRIQLFCYAEIISEEEMNMTLKRIPKKEEKAQTNETKS